MPRTPQQVRNLLVWSLSEGHFLLNLHIFCLRKDFLYHLICQIYFVVCLQGSYTNIITLLNTIFHSFFSDGVELVISANVFAACFLNKI
jgi:hypothetical protein